MEELSKEIRRILLGKYQKNTDGILSAVQPGEHRYLYGVQGHSTGRFTLRILGIAHRSQRCSLRSGLSKEQLDRKMKELGQLVLLESTPEASACLCNFWMMASVLLLAVRDGDCVEMTAYTARDVFAPFTCRRALRKLNNVLTDAAEKRKKQSAGRKKR